MNYNRSISEHSEISRNSSQQKLPNISYSSDNNRIVNSLNSIKPVVKGEQIKTLKAQLTNLSEKINFIDTNQVGIFVPTNKHSISNSNLDLNKIVTGIKYTAHKDIDDIHTMFAEIKSTTEIGMNKLTEKQKHAKSKQLLSDVKDLRKSVTNYIKEENNLREEQMNIVMKQIESFKQSFDSKIKINNDFLIKYTDDFKTNTRDISDILEKGVRKLTIRQEFYQKKIDLINQHFGLIPLDKKYFDLEVYENDVTKEKIHSNIFDTVKYQKRPEYSVKDIAIYNTFMNRLVNKKPEYDNISSVNRIIDKDKFGESKHINTKMFGSRRRLMIYFNTVRVVTRFHYFRFLWKYKIRFKTLQVTTSNFEACEKKLINVLFNQTQNSYLNYNTNNLRMRKVFFPKARTVVYDSNEDDGNSTSNINNVNFSDLKSIDESNYSFIKEVLVDQVKSISEIMDQDVLGKEEIMLLKMITTEDVLIPFEFYFNFELERLEHDYGGVTNLIKNQKIMILLIYIFIKLILIKINYNKENLKLIMSIFYREVLEWCKDSCELVFKGKNSDNVKIISNSNYSNVNIDERLILKSFDFERRKNLVMLSNNYLAKYQIIIIKPHYLNYVSINTVVESSVEAQTNKLINNTLEIDSHTNITSNNNYYQEYFTRFKERYKSHLISSIVSQVDIVNKYKTAELLKLFYYNNQKSSVTLLGIGQLKKYENSDDIEYVINKRLVFNDSRVDSFYRYANSEGFRLKNIIGEFGSKLLDFLNEKK